MYRTEDKRSAIYELQEFLSEIYFDEDIYKSGIYDDKTCELVRNFQLQEGLPVSGIADMITHQKIYNSYKKTKQNRIIREKNNKSISFPIKNTGYRTDMRRINRDIAFLLDRYGIHHNIREQPYFTEATEKGVSALRKIMRLEDKTEIDEEFYYRIILDIGRS